MNEDGSCNISIIEAVCEQINNVATEEKIVVIKSTVVPGSTEKLAKKYPDHIFVFNPEFLTEAHFIDDFLNQDRIILGYTSTRSIGELHQLYYDFTQTQLEPAKIIEVSSRVAEFVKYTANTFLATKIIFFNEIYQICEKSNVNYDDVIDLVLLDKRIGKSHYKVPCEDDFGFSKSCFPKDLNALISYANEIGVDTLLLDSVWAKNLLVRKNHDWENLSQITGKYKKK